MAEQTNIFSTMPRLDMLQDDASKYLSYCAAKEKGKTEEQLKSYIPRFFDIKGKLSFPDRGARSADLGILFKINYQKRTINVEVCANVIDDTYNSDGDSVKRKKRYTSNKDLLVEKFITLSIRDFTNLIEDIIDKFELDRKHSEFDPESDIETLNELLKFAGIDSEEFYDQCCTNIQDFISGFESTTIQETKEAINLMLRDKNYGLVTFIKNATSCGAGNGFDYELIANDAKHYLEQLLDEAFF